MTRLTTLVLALGIAAGGAQAQSLTDQIVTDLQARGFSGIEIKEGLGQTKVEAVRDGRKIEAVYDQASGRILKQEWERAQASDMFDGVRIRSEDRSFVRAGRPSDDSRADAGLGAGRGDDAGDDGSQSRSRSRDHAAGDDSHRRGHDGRSDDTRGRGSDDRGRDRDDDDRDDDDHDDD